MNAKVSRRLACGCMAGLFSGLAGAQTPRADALFNMPQRLSRPSQESDEGGLWAMMDREESKLKRSRLVMRDESLNSYVRNIVCTLGGEHCTDARVYVVRNPFFNATMAPNGMMQVWSGLLLRVSNEAQLAAVIGHEIGHYLGRHSLEGLRDAKGKSAVAVFAGLFGAVGGLVQLGLLASLYSFNRDQEREADRIGIDLMAKAGYAPAESATIWSNLLEEFRTNTDNKEASGGTILFASHPPSDERKTNLLERANGPLAEWSKTGQAHAQRYRSALKDWRLAFAQDDLELRRFAESQALYERFIRDDPQDAQAYYFLAEVFRTRAREGDAELALAQYEQAAARGPNFAERARGHGLALRSLKRHADAVTQLRQYRELKPDAADAALIDSYIVEMKS
jgi:beta-barrel assembly-enhancing protease